MIKQLQAMQQALEALEPYKSTATRQYTKIDSAIDSLRIAITDAEKQNAESLFKFMINNNVVLTLDQEGFYYKGDAVHDAGIAYRLFVEWMKESNNPEKQECETCANKRKRLMEAGFLKSPLRGEDHVD